MHSSLRQRVRVRMKRDPQPSPGVVRQEGKGRKRHLLVDTQGLMLKARVHSAKVQDREGIKVLLDLPPEHLPRLSHVWMDAAYTGHKAKGLTGWRVLVAPSKQKDEQGLRTVSRGKRDVRLRSYNARDGETFGSLMRLFRQFLF
jgi:hypothetical protein